MTIQVYPAREDMSEYMEHSEEHPMVILFTSLKFMVLLRVVPGAALEVLREVLPEVVREVAQAAVLGEPQRAAPAVAQVKNIIFRPLMVMIQEQVPRHKALRLHGRQ